MQLVRCMWVFSGLLLICGCGSSSSSNEIPVGDVSVYEEEAAKSAKMEAAAKVKEPANNSPPPGGSV